MLILGNALSLVGCIMMVAIGFVKKKEKILHYQCVQFGFMAAGNLVLGGMSGTITNVVGIFRNLAFAKNKGGWGLKARFILIQLVISFVCWIPDVFELLPIVATVIFVLFLDTKSDVLFKAINILAMAMWVVYDFSNRNYVAFIFDILTIVSSAMAMVSLLKGRTPTT